MSISITAVSDLHGYQPELPGGDLLLVAGDLTARDQPEEYEKFLEWAIDQHYQKVVCIAGNHDNETNEEMIGQYANFQYLQDSGTEFECLKIWGSPWTAWFHGINPKCAAFTKKHDDDLKKKWDLIPDDTDILITHSPPLGIMDACSHTFRAGSKSLTDRVMELNLRLHVFGHIHEGYGEIKIGKTRLVNASHVNRMYKNVNEPITVELDLERS